MSWDEFCKEYNGSAKRKFLDAVMDRLSIGMEKAKSHLESWTQNGLVSESEENKSKIIRFICLDESKYITIKNVESKSSNPDQVVLSAQEYAEIKKKYMEYKSISESQAEEIKKLSSAVKPLQDKNDELKKQIEIERELNPRVVALKEKEQKDSQEQKFGIRRMLLRPLQINDYNEYKEWMQATICKIGIEREGFERDLKRKYEEMYAPYNELTKECASLKAEIEQVRREYALYFAKAKEIEVMIKEKSEVMALELAQKMYDEKATELQKKHDEKMKEFTIGVMEGQSF